MDEKLYSHPSSVYYHLKWPDSIRLSYYIKRPREEKRVNSCAAFGVVVAGRVGAKIFPLTHGQYVSFKLNYRWID